MSGGSHRTAAAHGRNETRALRLMPSAEVKSGTMTSKLRESMLNGLAGSWLKRDGRSNWQGLTRLCRRAARHCSGLSPF